MIICQQIFRKYLQIRFLCRRENLAFHIFKRFKLSNFFLKMSEELRLNSRAVDGPYLVMVSCSEVGF